MRKKCFAFMLFAIGIAFSSLYAQKAPVRFGKVSEEELKMTVYAPDTSAAAVVLYQYGYFNANEYKFYLTRRIKILKKEGVDMIDYIFNASEDASVRGRTFNYVDGKIVEDKLKPESVFKEKLYGDYYLFRIAMPNVRVGSVVDIETTEMGLPGEFKFQDFLPVKHAELLLEEHQYVDYKKRAVGYEKIPGSTGNRYIMQDIPAFKEEPFMNSAENYMAKYEFDVLQVSFPGYYKSYATSWEAVNRNLRSSDYFGGVLTNPSGYMSEMADEIEKNYTDPLEKMKAAYEAIKRVKWDNKTRLTSSSVALSTVYKKGVGNSAEINMMLYLLLKRLNLNAWPVVLSSRDNGVLNAYSPSLNKLNSTIVCGFIGDDKYLMDASEQYAPFGLLPKRCINVNGRLVNNGDGTWIDLSTTKLDKSLIQYQLTLNNDLKLSGKYTTQKNDYAALDLRNSVAKSASLEKYIMQFESSNPGLVVKDYKFENLDSIYKPVVENFDIEIANKAEKLNDLILINPYIFEQLTQNPFKTDKRKYPIDFAYGRDKSVFIQITIPEGYTISELPKPMRIATPQNGASATISIAAAENQISIVYKLQINKPFLLPNDYYNLQELYNQLIKKQSEPIILKPV